LGDTSPAIVKHPNSSITSGGRNSASPPQLRDSTSADTHPASLLPSDQWHVCHACGKTFGTAAGLRSHRVFRRCSGGARE
jgi:hypothetical protein